MDESWRIPIGTVLPRRLSADNARAQPAPESLDLEDFRDVFGGPPRSVLLRRFSGELSTGSTAARSVSFYEEVFRPSEYGMAPGPARGGRSLPGFRIPAAASAGGGGGGGILRMEEGFYDDIFGSDGGDRRSRSRSSSSMRSSKERSPPRLAALPEDAGLASFASKLRPITIPSRRQNSSPRSTLSGGELIGGSRVGSSSCLMDFQDSNRANDNHNGADQLFRQKSHIGFSCCFSPPDTISLEPSFRRSHKVPESNNYFDLDSPSSATFSVFLDSLASRAEPSERWLHEQREFEKVVVAVEEDEEAIERSFVIEIDRHCTGENGGAAALDEAIAWAKEKFRNETSSKKFGLGEEQHHSMETKEQVESKESQLARGYEGDVVLVNSRLNYAKEEL